MKRTLIATAAALAALVLVPAAPPAAHAESKIRVLTTTTDLRELAKEVGGDDVEVTCLMKGPEDPHFLEARPSFVRAAAAADALVVNGLDLEVGYEPLLVGDSRNARIQKGKPGYVDCSKGIEVLELPEGPVDRSMGDVHPGGNPHYLLDPVRGKQAAANIAEAFSAISPEKADGFRKRLDAFRRSVDVAMFGEAVLASQPAERLERRLREGTIGQFLKDRELDGKLGGLAADMQPCAGRKAASYHATFIYLLDRFHVADAARLEPKPGVPPTPKHLQGVVETMKAAGVPVVLFTVFQPEKTAQSVAAEAGATALRLAHQPGATGDTGGYLDTVKANVGALLKALKGGAR